MVNEGVETQDPLQEEMVVDRSEVEDADIGAAVRYTISSYGVDYPVDGLVKRISKGDVYVPEFQRGFVWTHAQASRFVESLLLGLPVPGVFLFKEPDTQKLVVVDGQQRLRTLGMFYDGVIRKREFALKGVCDEMAGATYRSLAEEDRRRLDDAIIHATVFQQDDPTDDRSSIYSIFERLNTGGTPLASQEIRSCVYRGQLDDLLDELAQTSDWREIYGPPSNRGKDQELILRFFALYYDLQSYKRPMKGFLNDFMQENISPSETRLQEMRELFTMVLSVAAESLTRNAFRPERNLNAAVLDAFLVGLARRLEQGPIQNPAALKSAAERLFDQEPFTSAITSGTTAEGSIRRRLRLASEAFGSVP